MKATGIKRLGSALLPMVLLLALLCAPAAASDEIIDQGSDEKLSDQTLRIAGSGDMDDYEAGGAPWSYAASGIRLVSIGADVTRIGSYAFYGFTGLRGINLPDGLRSIGRYAFRFCGSLTRSALPASVHEIPDGLFCGCERLRAVYAAGEITVVGTGAFDGCKALTDIYCAGSAANWRSGDETEDVNLPDQLCVHDNTVSRSCALPEEFPGAVDLIESKDSYRLSGVLFRDGAEAEVMLSSYRNRQSGAVTGEHADGGFDLTLEREQNDESLRLFVLDSNFRPICPAVDITP